MHPSPAAGPHVHDLHVPQLRLLVHVLVGGEVVLRNGRYGPHTRGIYAGHCTVAFEGIPGWLLANGFTTALARAHLPPRPGRVLFGAGGGGPVGLQQKLLDLREWPGKW